MTSDPRARRLLDEFIEGANSNCHSVRHGLAAVLRHIADTEDDADCRELAVPVSTLRALADALTAPTLLDRAMAGDARAARRFLHEAGFTDERGQWLPQFQPMEDQ